MYDLIVYMAYNLWHLLKNEQNIGYHYRNLNLPNVTHHIIAYI